MRALCLVLVLASSACALVPQNRRARLADKTMQLDPDPLESEQRNKLHTTREGAAGGDGTAAGGGCGCR